MSQTSVQGRLNIQPKDPVNYYKCLPIKPGCFFYPSLLPYVRKLRQLHLNVPLAAFAFDQENYLVYTNYKGEIAIQKEEHFEEKFCRKIIEEANVSPAEKDCTPIVFNKFSPYPNPCTVIVEPVSCAAFEKTIIRQKPQAHLVQQIINGKTSSFVRLVYYPEKQLSEGHLVDNILLSFDDIKVIDDKLHKHFGMNESYTSPKYFSYKGASLADFEKEAKKLYRFLLYDVGMRVNKLTMDFMRDKDKKIWFLGLKSYELEENSYRLKQTQYLMNEQEMLLTKRVRKEEAENTVICKMCGLRCRVPELNKRLTLKMVYNVKEHLEKRGITIYENLKGEAPEALTHTLKVCSHCYSIAIAEYDLIETECKLAQIQGIPATLDTILSKPWKAKGENPNAIMDPFMYQWRIMVHIDNLLEIPPTIFRENTSYMIQYKIFGYTILFPLCFEKASLRKTTRDGSFITTHRRMDSSVTKRGFYEKPTLNINKLRTLYFFSPTCNLHDFLKTESLVIRITEGEDWEKDVAAGNANVFADCVTCDYVNNCVKYSKGILLFRKSNIEQIMKLKVNVGIIRGKKIDTSMIQMNPYSTYSIYFPPEGYLTSEQFPSEWMEIFEKDQASSVRTPKKRQLSYTFSIREQDISFYRPTSKTSLQKPGSRKTLFERIQTPLRIISKFASTASLPFGENLEDKKVAKNTRKTLGQPFSTTEDCELTTFRLSDTSESNRPQTATYRASRPLAKIVEKLSLESKKYRSQEADNPDMLMDIKEIMQKKKHRKRKLIKTFTMTKSFHNPYGETYKPPAVWQAGLETANKIKKKKGKKTLHKRLKVSFGNIVSEVKAGKDYKPFSTIDI